MAWPGQKVYSSYYFSYIACTRLPDLEPNSLTGEQCLALPPRQVFLITFEFSHVFSHLEANFLSLIESDIQILAERLKVKIGQDEVFACVTLNHDGGNLSRRQW